jgi:high-affinity iron transporter
LFQLQYQITEVNGEGMIPSFLISLREGLEAALIVGLTIGVLAKMKRSELKIVVWYGAVAAGLISLLVALILQFVGANLEGRTEELFEGFMMFLAAGVLTWMIFWMQRMSDVRIAISKGYRWGLFGIAFFAVLREGIETALFLTAAAMTTSTNQTFIGGLAGILVAAVLGWALFASTIRLNIQRFFQITSVLLILFAAGLFAHAIHEFNEAGLIPTLINPLWDINHILDENSVLGGILKALFGYNGNPSLTEVLAYLGYFVAVYLGYRTLTKLEKRPVQVG